MFFNCHGGNRYAKSKLIYRINHITGAIAVDIGAGASIKRGEKESKESILMNMRGSMRHPSYSTLNPNWLRWKGQGSPNSLSLLKCKSYLFIEAWKNARE